MEIKLSYIDDGLHNSSCTHSCECHEIVSLFRRQNASYRNTTPLFLGYTPSEVSSLPSSYLQSGITAIAGIDLTQYGSFEQVLEEARTCTEKRGRVNREINRAQKLGYYVKPFPFQLHVPDVYDIHRSKPIRNGRPLQGSYYLGTIEELGGMPRKRYEVKEPQCQIHNWQYWGVFKAIDGHSQGDTLVNERLVGYIKLRLQGNSAWYDKILGHGDYLKDGTMYLLHYEIFKNFLRKNQTNKPRYLVYHQYFTGGDFQLNTWKKKALFKPYYMIYVNDRHWEFPQVSSCQYSVQECMSITSSTIFKNLSLNQQYCEQQELDINLLKYWHRLWILDQTYNSGFLKKYYNPAQSFSLQDIFSLKTDNFPVPCFDSSHQSVIVYTESKSYGIEDLVYVDTMQLEHVTVAHNFHENSYIDCIKNTYNTGWQYTPTYNLKSFIDLFSKYRADVVICSCSQENIEQFVRDWLEWPWRSARKALVLSVSSKVLQLFNLKECFQPELIVPRLEDLYGFSVKDYKVYFKNMEDRASFWIILQKGGDRGEKS
jgi:hypothetical protein